ncbi:MAG: DUF4956 domain-containing protein [Alistipes sp.]|nr:DUF4956 domain-containing protein [Alistipes sp.]
MMLPLLQSLPDFDPSIAEEFGYAVSESTTFLGVPLFETTTVFSLLLRFFFNLLVAWIIIRCFYYRKSRRRDYFVTFMLFSSAMFLLIFLMENVKMQIGFMLGLFAIFGMIRYRTETVPIREMTYLFVIIAISVINGLALNISYAELVLANALIIALTAVLENDRILKHTSAKLILYDRIDLITPEHREEMIADIEKRVGLSIKRVEIGHVDFLKDTAFVKIYYVLDDEQHNNTIDNLTRAKDYIEQ